MPLLFKEIAKHFTPMKTFAFSCVHVFHELNKHGIGLQASLLWCGKCSRSILCLDLRIESDLGDVKLHQVQ